MTLGTGADDPASSSFDGERLLPGSPPVSPLADSALSRFAEPRALVALAGMVGGSAGGADADGSVGGEVRADGGGGVNAALLMALPGSASDIT